MDLIRAMCFTQIQITQVNSANVGQEEDYLVDRLEGADTFGSQERADTFGSQERADIFGSQERSGEVSSQGGAGTFGSQGGAGIDDAESLYHGTHETLEAVKGEEDQCSSDKCKKNPGHAEFIPINDFNIHHLPKGLQDEAIVDFIKATADLTVRVEVETTSIDRPKIWPNTNENYPSFNNEGTSFRWGTGMVCYVKKEDKDNRTCKCQKCQQLNTPSKVWGEVCIYTATHLVFDDVEARQTTCRLFFDSEDSQVVTLGGWTMGMANINNDKCFLTCVTCDIDLLDKLLRMRKRWKNLFFNKYTKDDESMGAIQRMMFIVSHPHEFPKRVSVGYWVNMIRVEGHRTKFTYTTCTCPGSSGAYIHPLMYDPFLFYYHHVHSGVNKIRLNFSGFGREAPLF